MIKIGPQEDKTFWNAEYEILDKFDTLLYFGHNSLVWTPIEVIQIAMEIQEEDVQFSCFLFLRFKLDQG